MLIRTLIVDDEAHIRRSLSAMLAIDFPHVQLVGTADGVESGLAAIEKYHPDVVLLDIKMNDGTGMELLTKCKPVNFRVIFITAYEEYAIQAFKCSAIDYLLKPIALDDLKAAFNKVMLELGKDYQTLLRILEDNLNTRDPAHRKLVLKSQDSIWLVKTSDILYCEAETSYTRFYFKSGSNLLITGNLMEYELMLKSAGFFRCHKSFLINVSEIVRFEKGDGGFIVISNNMKIPVASRKKDELIELFRNFA